MANETNDISEIVKKCKILLLDIEGTTTSISFVKDKLFPYAEENVKEFLSNEWESDDVKEAVTALRKLALEDAENKVDGVVAIPAEDASKEDQIEGLVKSVKWQMSLDRKVAPLKQLQGLIWKKGYDKGDIKGHVYEDVSPALEQWRSVEGQKVYIYSSGSVQAQKLLFGMSSAGDMLKLIDGHFDTAVGAKQEAASYTNIAEKIGSKPEEILFLTDIDKEAIAARKAGVQAALVSREGNAPLSAEVTAAYAVLYSLAELAGSNKRKPDAQDEQPAKVLKTDAEADVKTASETVVKESPEPVTTPAVEKADESEKMEVDEAPSKEAPAEKPTEEVVKGATEVEEITDLTDISDIPISNVKPIIEEIADKTEQKETETMETEAANSVSEPKENTELKNGDKDAPVPEEIPPAVITEIKDVTNDKEGQNDEAEIIDIVPVVEEPAQDMEELQNVGEVLDKECDEILSKVQDVTNLDNIPVKPLLNTIAEETMEIENTDTNDLVENILDTEQELEMKKCNDIAQNAAQEIAAEKTVTEDGKNEKQDVVNTENVNVASEENTSAINVEETKVTDEKVETNKIEEKVKENSPAEEKPMESSPAEEKAMESNPAEEKPMESSSGEEKSIKSSPAIKSSLTEEKAVQVSPAEEKDMAVSPAEEKVVESSPTEDKVVENSVKKQNGEGNSPVESKTATTKVQTEEEKVKPQENNDNKMETEESTTEIKKTEVASQETTDEKINTKSTETKAVEKTAEISAEKPAEKPTGTSTETLTEIPPETPTETSTEKPKEKSTETSVETPKETSSDKPAESAMETEQSETPVETKENDKAAGDKADKAKPENDVKESQINGKTTNGDADMVDLNGDASKDDELSSRLSMENGKEVVNGANGNSSDSVTKSENNGEEVKEVADIKVKSVAVDEPRNDPIEQPTEA